MSGYGYNSYSDGDGDGDDRWSKSRSEHVCRPVIIDAEGRKQPIIRYTASSPHNKAESYVVQTETYVEHVHPPTNYSGRYSGSPTKVVSPPPEDAYEFNQHQGQILRSPVHNRPQKVEEFITTVQTEAYNKPTRTSPFSTTYSRPQKVEEVITTVQTEAYNKPTRTSPFSTTYSRPQKVEEVITTVQTEAYNKPTRTSPFSTTYSRPQKVEEVITTVQTEAYNKPTRTSPFSTTYSRPTGHNSPTGYGDYNDYNHNNNNNNNGGHNGYYPREEPNGHYPKEESNGYYHREEPNRAPYWSTPASEERGRATTAQLTKPTTDISQAIEYLKEAVTTAKPFTGRNNLTSPAVTAFTQKPRFTIGVPPPRRSDYGSSTTTSTASMETISSSEAKKRYGSASSLPYTTGESENYASTIDSKEAMKRYNGRIV